VKACGQDWSVAEYICCSGPEDRPFEERHENFTIAAVVEGTFTYRCDAGTGLLHPGALLLGNSGRCFECGHDHSRGDRCIALHLSSALFSEIAASSAATARYNFGAAMLPATSNSIGLIASLQSAAAMDTALLNDAFVIELAETVLVAASGCTPRPVQASRDVRRISEVLHYIEDNAGAPVDLESFASSVHMSKYHFLRIFRQVIGMPPYRYLLNLRMRRAALRLATSVEPVSTVVYDAGFGDLSTFNNRFRALFGVSPRAYRRQQGNPLQL
jgi:AraC family transcriptional regulator